MPWDVRVSGDGVAIVCMESSRANEINDMFLDDLEAALEELRKPHRVRVAVFTRRAAGAVFSSGLDLFRNFNDRAFTARFIKRYEQCMEAVLTLPMVTVAALTGTTVAGGCVLALACDFRVAMRGRYPIGVNEVLNNVPFPRMTTAIVCNALPRRAARLALYVGHYWRPEEAARDSVVDGLVDKDDYRGLIDRAVGIAARLPLPSVDAVGKNKRNVLRAVLAEAAPDAAGAGGGEDDGGYAEFLDAAYSEAAQAQFEALRRQLRSRRKAAPAATSSSSASASVGGGAGAAGDDRDHTDGEADGDADGEVLAVEGAYVFEVLRPRHVAEVIGVLVKVWVHDNAIMRSLGVTEAEFLPLATKRVTDAAALGMSVVVSCPRRPPSDGAAGDAASDSASSAALRPCGFFLWEDMSASAWEEKLQISEKFEPQFAFMSQLEGEYARHRRGKAIPRGEVLHGIYGGVEREHAGQQVTTTLLSLSADLAARRGYRKMVTEAVAIGSQHVSFKLGWRDIALKQYSQWAFESPGGVGGGLKPKGAPRYPFAKTALLARTPCAVLFELDLAEWAASRASSRGTTTAAPRSKL